MSTESRVLAAAETVSAELGAQKKLWDRGFTRRRLLAGAGMVAVASIGSQLVTTKHAYAAAGTSNGKTLVTVFLRGGMDGLATVVPRNNPTYIEARGTIGIPTSTLLNLDSTFGMHPSCAPLYPLWQSGKLGMVHAVGSPSSDRDHFASQARMEKGEDTATIPSGWLDRALLLAGPGTTFRAVSEGNTVAASLQGDNDTVAMQGIGALVFTNPAPNLASSLSALYTGLDNPIEGLMETAIAAVAAATPIRATPPGPATGAVYSVDSFGTAMADIARLIKADAGLRVATVDFGGWDLHTNAGVWDDGDQKNFLADFSKTMAAFATDIGSHMADVTVVTMSEFGRRLEMNGSGGTDHGFGGLMFLMGGMVRGGRMHGDWPGLETLDHGDLTIANDYRDILSEVAQKTLNLGNVSTLFPRYTAVPKGVMV
ncbi:MAG: DUF1501 domain-containing protein [Geodermatophilaceae bacterium]|nr:DUF1501 domain-containing protein [Geodermatophilaceae bacterium]